MPSLALAAGFQGPKLAGIPVDFLLFGLVLAGVALFHHYVLPIALGGAIVISLYKIVWSPFHAGAGVAGWVGHLGHEAVI